MFSDSMLISSELVPLPWWMQYSMSMQQKRALPYMEAVFRFRERNLWPRFSYSLLNSSGDRMEGLLLDIALQLLKYPMRLFCPWPLRWAFSCTNFAMLLWLLPDK